MGVNYIFNQIEWLNEWLVFWTNRVIKYSKTQFCERKIRINQWINTKCIKREVECQRKRMNNKTNKLNALLNYGFTDFMNCWVGKQLN